METFKTRNYYCPNSEKLDSETFTIPLHPGLTSKEVDYVIQEIKNQDN